MPVAQLGEHIGEHLEELSLAEAAGGLRGIAVVDLLPVDVFLVEETIVAVHDLPEGLEIAVGGVGVFLFIDTRYERQEQEEEEVSHFFGKKIRVMSYGV